jgi:hypothetical protein
LVESLHVDFTSTKYDRNLLGEREQRDHAVRQEMIRVPTLEKCREMIVVPWCDSGHGFRFTVSDVLDWAAQYPRLRYLEIPKVDVRVLWVCMVQDIKADWLAERKALPPSTLQTVQFGLQWSALLSGVEPF